MFSNFIYFIIVLLIYTTYQPTEETNFSLGETCIFFIAFIVAFASFCRLQFHKLEKRILRENFVYLDHQFSVTLSRQFIMSIMLFAIDIYGLNLPSFFIPIPFFSVAPTIQALIFLLLFTFYLAIVWGCAYDVYQKLYPADISRRSYIQANISLAVPVLLPWFLLSIFTDLIKVLPYAPLRIFFSTTEGEVLCFLVFLFLVVIIGPDLVRRFWRCKPLKPGYHRKRIENLCRKAGLEYANILYWPMFGGGMITAAVMGLVKKFRYILVTEGLLRLLNTEEIEAVIAHEIGHVKRKHLVFYLFFFTGYMLLSYATFDLIIYFIIYSKPVFVFISRSGLNEAMVISAAFNLVVILMFIVYFRYVFGYFMRNFERQADAYVYVLFESAAPLISTFEKITLTSGQSPDKPNWHHFSITERVEYLKKCEDDKTWITRHDQKIKKRHSDLSW